MFHPHYSLSLDCANHYWSHIYVHAAAVVSVMVGYKYVVKNYRQFGCIHEFVCATSLIQRNGNITTSMQYTSTLLLNLESNNPAN